MLEVAYANGTPLPTKPALPYIPVIVRGTDDVVFGQSTQIPTLPTITPCNNNDFYYEGPDSNVTILKTGGEIKVSLNANETFVVKSRIRRIVEVDSTGLATSNVLEIPTTEEYCIMDTQSCDIGNIKGLPCNIISVGTEGALYKTVGGKNVEFAILH